MLDYKHTAEAIAKMKQRLADKKKITLCMGKHTLVALKAISKPGELNPMYNKTHNIKTRHNP